MNYKDIEFHNVDHFEAVEGMAGLRLERFPASFAQSLGEGKENHNGRFRARRAHGCEMRFVTDAPYFDVALTAAEDDVDILVYLGDMNHSKHTLKAGVCSVLHIEYPPMFEQVEAEELPKNRFAPNVWRIQFGMNGNIYFHYLDVFGHAIRPPKEEEKPVLNWVAYGSSITCGSVTTLYSNAYIEQAALQLQVDVENKGLSGSCLLEEEVAEYLAERETKILSLEIGVNLLPYLEQDEFRQRIQNFLDIIHKKAKAQKIYVIDMFAHRGPILLDKTSNQYQNYEQDKLIIKKLVEELRDERFTYINGRDIGRDLTYLSVDLLHPSDNGHIRMGQNLAERIWQDLTYVKN